MTDPFAYPEIPDNVEGAIQPPSRLVSCFALVDGLAADDQVVFQVPPAIAERLRQAWKNRDALHVWIDVYVADETLTHPGQG